MLIPDPDFYPFRIPNLRSQILDPTTGPKEVGEKFFLCPTSFCNHKYHKIVNYFIFEQVKKLFSAKTLGIILLFAHKFVITLSKIWDWIRDPGSGKNLFRIPGQKGSGSATLRIGLVSKSNSVHYKIG
jgi:hypothetical protein